MAKVSFDCTVHLMETVTPVTPYKPTGEELGQIHQGCVLALEKMGILSKLLEVVKVKLWQKSQFIFPEVELTAIFSPPSGSHPKMEVVAILGNGRRFITNPAKIVKGLVSEILLELSRELARKEQEVENLTLYISEITAVNDHWYKNSIPCPECGLPVFFSEEDLDETGGATLTCQSCSAAGGDEATFYKANLKVHYFLD